MSRRRPPWPTRYAQESFAAGMFRSVAPELIPANGAYDLTNSLLDEDGADRKRGGSVYESGAVGEDLTMIWSGWLTAGQRTIVASASRLWAIAGGIAVAIPGSTGLAAPHRPVVMDGVMYLPGGETYNGTTLGTAAVAAPFYASVANRLLYAIGDKVGFSAIGNPSSFAATDYHRMPGGVQILGIEGLRDSAVVFTTNGIYVIGNMAFNLTDAAGNVQQSLDRYSGDLSLWGEAGIAGWSGSLVVPALDGVWLMSLGLKSEAAQHFDPISLPIDGLYRDYVRQGFTVGQATVIRSHYILPVYNGPTVVDVLVCRLDGVDSSGRQTFPWTHMDGLSGRALGYATRLDGTSPVMLAINADRVVRCHWFDPDLASTEADGSIPAWEIITRAYPTGWLTSNTVLKLRARYDMRASGGAPQITAGIALPGQAGAQWGLFDWGTADWTAIGIAFDQLDGGAPTDVGALKPFSWRVGRKVQYATFRLQETQDCTLVLRALELYVRDTWRF